jgi:hypothetical protein
MAKGKDVMENIREAIKRKYGPILAEAVNGNKAVCEAIARADRAAADAARANEAARAAKKAAGKIVMAFVEANRVKAKDIKAIRSAIAIAIANAKAA